MTEKVALITGIATEIGLETARALKKDGFIVFGASGRPEDVGLIPEENISLLYMDATNQQSIKECMDTLLFRRKRIDVLINILEGTHGIPLQSESPRNINLRLQAFKSLGELAIADMKERKFGKIVNITVVNETESAQHLAIRFTVEGLSAELRKTAQKDNIHVIEIEATDNSTAPKTANDRRAGVSHSVYAAILSRGTQEKRRDYGGVSTSQPGMVARCVAKAVLSTHPKDRYQLGQNSLLLNI